MLLYGYERIMTLLFKIFGCDIILMLCISILTENLAGNFLAGDYKIVYVLPVILIIFVLIIILIRKYMIEFYVPFKKVKTPLCIITLPSILLCSCRVFCTQYFMENEFLFIYFIIGMVLLLDIWVHKKMKMLPDIIISIDPQLKEKFPEIARRDVCRISEIGFLKNVNAALEQIPKEKMSIQLQDAISDWHSVYVSIVLALEGVFLGMWAKVLLTYYI